MVPPADEAPERGWRRGRRSVGDVPIARLGLGLLVDVTIGNVVVRVRNGSVVAVVDVGIGVLRWPAFNVADSSFVIGTIVMVAYIVLWGDEPAQDEAPAPPDPAAVAPPGARAACERLPGVPPGGSAGDAA